MKFTLLCLFGLTLTFVNSAIRQSSPGIGSFSWDICNQDDPDYLEFLDVQPDPIIIPGMVTLSLTLTLSEDVVAPAEGDIYLTYRINENFNWVDIPCFAEEVFSCHYNDFCDFIDDAFPPDTPCPESFGDVPCRCPYKAGHYQLVNATFEFPNHSLLIQGDYHLKVDITGKTCYDVYFTLKNA